MLDCRGLCLLVSGVVLSAAVGLPQGEALSQSQLSGVRGGDGPPAYAECHWFPDGAQPNRPNCNACAESGANSVKCDVSKTSSPDCQTYVSTTDCIRCRVTPVQCPGNAWQYPNSTTCQGTPVQIGDCSARVWSYGQVDGNCEKATCPGA